MARKPENNWIARVNKHVDPKVHREKMANPFRRGTADMWYSGTSDDLWVEYKWLPSLPVRALIDPSKLLEPLQLKWIRERHADRTQRRRVHWLPTRRGNPHRSSLGPYHVS